MLVEPELRLMRKAWHYEECSDEVVSLIGPVLQAAAWRGSLVEKVGIVSNWAGFVVQQFGNTMYQRLCQAYRGAGDTDG